MMISNACLWLSAWDESSRAALTRCCAKNEGVRQGASNPPDGARPELPQWASELDTILRRGRPWATKVRQHSPRECREECS